MNSLSVVSSILILLTLSAANDGTHMAVNPRLIMVLLGEQATVSKSAKAELATIEFYTAAIDRYIKSNPRSRIFGDGSSHWREFRSKAELEKAATRENLNQSAFVWMRHGKVVAADLAFTTPSGDYAHYITYYFREDGTLAKIQSRLNTFVSSYGGMSVLRDSYYDAREGSFTNHLSLSTAKSRYSVPNKSRKF